MKERQMADELKLPITDEKWLQFARGWLDLGQWCDADEDLQKISPKMRTHPDVLRVRFHVYAMAGKWQGAFDIARVLTQPSSAPVGDLFNFARAACRLGKLPDAFHSIRRAIERAGSIEEKQKLQLMVLDDEDFKPLWVDIGRI